jgi:hypothetical protein
VPSAPGEGPRRGGRDVAGSSSGRAARLYGLAASALQALIALVILWTFAHPMGGPGSDLEVYLSYSTRILRGEVPYRHFDVEYPPLSLPIFLLPRLFASDLSGYQVAFAVEMLLFNAMAVDLVVRRVERDEGLDRVPERLAWYTLSWTFLSPLMLVRYDLAPTVLGFAAASWWSSGRALRGGFAAGLGVMMKVFPGVCVLPALVREVSHRGTSRLRGTWALLATVAIGLASWMTISGPGMKAALNYHVSRGIGIESLYAGALLLRGQITGDVPPIVHKYSAYQLGGPWAGRLSSIALPMQAVAICAVLALYRSSRMSDEIRFAGGVLLAFAITGKVMSPQYMIWLLPFLVAVDGPTGRWGRPLFALCCLATTMVFPLYFGSLLRMQPGAILLLNARNALLLALLALLMFGPRARPSAKTDGCH